MRSPASTTALAHGMAGSLFLGFVTLGQQAPAQSSGTGFLRTLDQEPRSVVRRSEDISSVNGDGGEFHLVLTSLTSSTAYHFESLLANAETTRLWKEVDALAAELLNSDDIVSSDSQVASAVDALLARRDKRCREDVQEWAERLGKDMAKFED